MSNSAKLAYEAANKELANKDGEIKNKQKEIEVVKNAKKEIKGWGDDYKEASKKLNELEGQLKEKGKEQKELTKVQRDTKLAYEVQLTIAKGDDLVSYVEALKATIDANPTQFNDRLRAVATEQKAIKGWKRYLRKHDTYDYQTEVNALLELTKRIRDSLKESQSLDAKLFKSVGILEIYRAFTKFTAFLPPVELRASCEIKNEAHYAVFQFMKKLIHMAEFTDEANHNFNVINFIYNGEHGLNTRVAFFTAPLAQARHNAVVESVENYSTYLDTVLDAYTIKHTPADVQEELNRIKSEAVADRKDMAQNKLVMPETITKDAVAKALTKVEQQMKVASTAPQADVTEQGVETDTTGKEATETNTTVEQVAQLSGYQTEFNEWKGALDQITAKITAAGYMEERDTQYQLDHAQSKQNAGTVTSYVTSLQEKVAFLDQLENRLNVTIQDEQKRSTEQNKEIAQENARLLEINNFKEEVQALFGQETMSYDQLVQMQAKLNSKSAEYIDAETLQGLQAKIATIIEGIDASLKQPFQQFVEAIKPAPVVKNKEEEEGASEQSHADAENESADADAPTTEKVAQANAATGDEKFADETVPAVATAAGESQEEQLEEVEKSAESTETVKTDLDRLADSIAALDDERVTTELLAVFDQHSKTHVDQYGVDTKNAVENYNRLKERQEQLAQLKEVFEGIAKNDGDFAQLTEAQKLEFPQLAALLDPAGARAFYNRVQNPPNGKVKAREAVMPYLAFLSAIEADKATSDQLNDLFGLSKRALKKAQTPKKNAATSPAATSDASRRLSFSASEDADKSSQGTPKSGSDTETKKVGWSWKDSAAKKRFSRFGSAEKGAFSPNRTNNASSEVDMSEEPAPTPVSSGRSKFNLRRSNKPSPVQQSVVNDDATSEDFTGAFEEGGSVVLSTAPDSAPKVAKKDRKQYVLGLYDVKLGAAMAAFEQVQLDLSNEITQVDAEIKGYQETQFTTVRDQLIAHCEKTLKGEYGDPQKAAERRVLFVEIYKKDLTALAGEFDTAIAAIPKKEFSNIGNSTAELTRVKEDRKLYEDAIKACNQVAKAFTDCAEAIKAQRELNPLLKNYSQVQAELQLVMKNAYTRLMKFVAKLVKAFKIQEKNWPAALQYRARAERISEQLEKDYKTHLKAATKIDPTKATVGEITEQKQSAVLAWKTATTTLKFDATGKKASVMKENEKLLRRGFWGKAAQEGTRLHNAIKSIDSFDESHITKVVPTR